MLDIAAADESTLDHRRRAERAVAEAVDRRKFHAIDALAERDSVRRFEIAHELTRADRLAGLGDAHLHVHVGRRRLAQIVVVGEDANDFCARDVELGGNDVDRVVGNPAEDLLDALKRGEDEALGGRNRSDDGGPCLDRPCLVTGHLGTAFRLAVPGVSAAP